MNPIIQAFRSIELSSIWFRDMRSKQWKLLFDYYNERNEKKLSMSCVPCYIKVRNFIKQEIENGNIQ